MYCLQWVCFGDSVQALLSSPSPFSSYRVRARRDRTSRRWMMTMRTAALTLLLFLCLVAASLGSLVVSKRLPARYRQDDTQDVVRLAANIFVVTTSLVLGLLFNSARNNFE